MSRKVVAAFAVDQTAFFSSSDIQYLRIGTILKAGLLLPPSLDPAATVHCSGAYLQPDECFLLPSKGIGGCQKLSVPLLCPDWRTGRVSFLSQI